MSSNRNRGDRIANLIGSRSQLAQMMRRPLAKGALWSFSGYGAQFGIQAIYFVIIARTLGAAQYGAFISTSALANIFAPAVGLGTEMVLLKNIARNPRSFRIYWGNAMFTSACCGTAAITILISFYTILFGRSASIAVVVCICVADLFFARLLEVIYAAFQGFGNLSGRTKLMISLNLFRLGGIGSLALLSSHATAMAWSFIYLATSIMTCLGGICWTFKLYGAPAIDLKLLRRELCEGMYFSASMSSMSIYNDIDKSMTARLSGLNAAGTYAAAYRLIDYAFLPIRSILMSAYPEFFRKGESGLKQSACYGRRLLGLSLPYSFSISIVLFLCAPLIPLFLGKSFADAVPALRWLCPLPVLKSFHYFAADSLTGAGFQKQRTIIQAAVAAFNVGLNFWLIPVFGWLGASWSSLASDGCLAVLLWLILRRFERASTAEPANQAGIAVSGGFPCSNA